MSFQPLKSVAIIPDGNRRYARKKNLPIEAAYLAGFKKAGEFSKWAFDEKVKTVSLWALSLDNFSKRSEEELTTLFKLMSRHIDDALKHPKFKDNNCRIKFFGRRDLLPIQVQNKMVQLEEKTTGSEQCSLNIGIAYGGREELVNVSRKIALDVATGKVKPEEIDENTFSKYLYFNEYPQLIIRTGNVQRLSGFLPWQNSYSELYFSQKLWPEFTREDFLNAKQFFETTEQRFGT